MDFAFSVGDRVVVQDYDYLKAHRGESPMVTPSMLACACKSAVVISVTTNSRREARYWLDILPNRCWAESWLICAGNDISQIPPEVIDDMF